MLRAGRAKQRRPWTNHSNGWRRLHRIPDAAPQIVNVRIWRAISQVRSGDRAAAASEAASLSNPPPAGGVDRYNLACVYSLCAAAAHADATLATAERGHQAEADLRRGRPHQGIACGDPFSRSFPAETTVGRPGPRGIAGRSRVSPLARHEPPPTSRRQVTPEHDMADRQLCIDPQSVVTGWDFSTGAVKCLAFDLDGRTLAEVRLPTDLWTGGGVSELNLMQLEGQARASTRAIAARLRDLGRLRSLGRRRHLGHAPHRRPHRRRPRPGAPGHLLERPQPRRLPRPRPGTPRRPGARPRADRRAVGHPLLAQPPVKDEEHPVGRRLASAPTASCRTGRWRPAYLTGNFDVVSVSAAASTGIMDLRTQPVVPGDARRPGEAGVPRPGLETVAAHRRAERADRPAVAVAGPGSGHRRRSGGR